VMFDRLYGLCLVYLNTPSRGSVANYRWLYSDVVVATHLVMTRVES